MLNLLFILIILSSLGGVFTFYIWHKINYSWLEQTIRFLVLSLPFERIPSFDTPMGNFRISQFLILFGLYLVLILFLKKDSKLLATRFNFSHLLVLAFFIFSIPSWFFVLDFNRFLVYMVATTFVFLAYTLISLFLANPVKTLKELVMIMFLLGIFGFYQLIGDFLGIPYQLTGLRETYTKINFGMARIHTTAIEPLYYAGMLFLPLFFTTILAITKQPVLELDQYPKLKNLKNRIFTKLNVKKTLTKFKLNWLISAENFTFLVFAVILANFVLTTSKGAWFSIGLALPFFILVLFKYFHLTDFLKKFSNFLYPVIATGIFSFFYIEDFNTILNNFFSHIQSVLEFNTATSVERLAFVVAALEVMPSYIITGIGPGQYGVWYGLIGGISRTRTIVDPISDIATEVIRTDQIVNNIYLEVWLEFGLFSFLAFLSFLVLLILTAGKNIFKTGDVTEKLFHKPFRQGYLAVFFSVTVYFIQWTFFSPIYIMSIFILLGVLQKFNSLLYSKY